VSWGNAERVGERARIGPAAAGLTLCRPETAQDGDSSGEMPTRPTPARSRREHMTKLPDHGDALRMAAFLDSHPGWSAFWDKRDGVWRAAEDDPSSELYAENADAGRVIDYMAAHAQQEEARHDHGE